MHRQIITGIILIIITCINSIYSTVYGNELLTPKECHFVNIASYTAKGNQPALEKEFNAALNDKVTIYEIKEVLVQLYAYCGFPRSINALTTFMRVTDERASKGGYDEYGTEPTDLPPDSNKYDIGTAVQTELIGGVVTGRIYEFEPAIDKYLKEHLFADIFARGVLSYDEREIITVAALSSMTEVEPQLQAHIKIAQNTGVSKEKIDEVLKLTNYKTKAQIEEEKKVFKNIIFERGTPNTDYADRFRGQSYLNILNQTGIRITNVTFEPKCRNNWHIHHKSGQVLLVLQGRGYYQEFGKPAQELHPGDVINVPPEVKHWHGASKNSWFVHLVIEAPVKKAETEWLEPVNDVEYNNLP